MYLSRIKLNTKNRHTMLALSNPQKIHGAIESAFPGERRRNLWRLDELDGKTYLLVLSEEKPDLTSVVTQFGYAGDTFETRSYAALLDRLTTGSHWQFRLTANPTVSQQTKIGERGKVMAHITTAHQEEWLLDRAEKHGFQLLPEEFRVTKTQNYAFHKRDNNTVMLLSVTYDGILTVTDPEKFRSAMVEGIGRGKAYGNGLLTVMHI